MIRMEISLVLILSFIAFVYFSAGPKFSALHRCFSILLIALIVHLVFDGITVYTVNHLDTVPVFLNDLVHRIFIGTMVFVMYMFYQYIAILVEQETGKPRQMDLPARIYLLLAEIGVLFLPVHYAVTPQGNYSDGIHANVCYVSVAVYLILCTAMMLLNIRQIEKKKRMTINVALMIMLLVSILQSGHPTWLISGLGMTLMTMAFYLTLENPDILRAEITENKMSMLYLKSQVNPHFLYNTLDTIRIQAQLNGDHKVAELLMHLVDFFRLSVKINQPMVELDSEMELVEAYMELICYRYPELTFECDIDPELLEYMVPNFILQPIVENSVLHGLKNKGYRGSISIHAHPISDEFLEIEVVDTGTGFAEGKKEMIDQMLRTYAKQAPKLEGNSIGLLNVQKRIKFLCGSQCGLSFTNNPEGGVTAHLRLSLVDKE